MRAKKVDWLDRKRFADDYSDADQHRRLNPALPEVVT